MENGSDYNLSELSMECHIGTHVDAPGHFNQAHFAAGLDVDTLDLEVLNGELPGFLRPKPRFDDLVTLRPAICAHTVQSSWLKWLASSDTQIYVSICDCIMFEKQWLILNDLYFF
ncbi:unnamed protein product [Triticum turgidum subsp. durum]|uniref:Kynurenine formamidase n=1 Tax=Triticum turgidum subsp. durum TaxID=4567 RepID=A0A9R0YL63_TRITD|nr:unnamed protein product [Triticum turgidum subsp. durum]